MLHLITSEELKEISSWLGACEICDSKCVYKNFCKNCGVFFYAGHADTCTRGKHGHENHQTY